MLKKRWGPYITHEKDGDIHHMIKTLPFSQGTYGLFFWFFVLFSFSSQWAKGRFITRGRIKEFWSRNHNHTIKDVPEGDIFLSWDELSYFREKSIEARCLDGPAKERLAGEARQTSKYSDHPLLIQLLNTVWREGEAGGERSKTSALGTWLCS